MRDSEHKYIYIIYPTTKNNKLTHENSKLTIPRIKFHQIPIARGKRPKGFFLIFFILYYDQQCTIISQIITLLHVSTLSCYPQGSCNQCLAKLVFQMQLLVIQFTAYDYDVSGLCKSHIIVAEISIL